MTDDEKWMLSMDASMEGLQTMMRNHGGMVKVSRMELIVLCNLAEIGLLSMFAELDGAEGEAAAADLEQHLAAVRRAFDKDGQGGLNRLNTNAAALLRGRFRQYLVGLEETKKPPGC